MKLFARIVTTLCLTLFFVAPAMAGSMSLMDAKSAGLIGEKQDGLVAAVLPNPSGDIQQLVNTTNSGPFTKKPPPSKTSPLMMSEKLPHKRYLAWPHRAITC
jgi:hypothetical protein